MEKTFVTLSVRSSSKTDLESKLDLNSREINQALKKAVVQKTNIPLSLKDVYVTIRQGGQGDTLTFGANPEAFGMKLIWNV